MKQELGRYITSIYKKTGTKPASVFFSYTAVHFKTINHNFGGLVTYTNSAQFDRIASCYEKAPCKIENIRELFECSGLSSCSGRDKYQKTTTSVIKNGKIEEKKDYIIGS